MIELTRSRPAMALASIAALVATLSFVLAATAYASYGGYQDLGTYTDLSTAAQWLAFGAGSLVLAGTVYVSWALFLARRWRPMWETASASLFQLLFVIGLLVIAAEPNSGADPGNVLAAIGIGGWAVVIGVGAALQAQREQDDPVLPHQALIRLAGAGSLLVIAVGFGLPNPSLNDAALAIAKAVLGAVGLTGLVIVLSVARSRRLLVTRTFTSLAWSLWVLVLAEIALAVGRGLVYGTPPPTILTFRIALSVPFFIEALAFLGLSWTAFGRFNEIGSAVGVPNNTSILGSTVGPYAAGLRAVPPSWQADPTHRNDLRWWDGAQWSDHVLNGNEPSLDPLPPP